VDRFVYSRLPLIGPQALRADIPDEDVRAQSYDESLEDPNTQKLVDSSVLPPLKSPRPSKQLLLARFRFGSDEAAVVAAQLNHNEVS